MEKMFAYDPKERVSLEEIKKHPWYRDFVYAESDIALCLRTVRRKKGMSDKPAAADSTTLKQLF